MSTIDKIPDLTDEQKKKLKKLSLKYCLKSVWIATKFVTLLFLANLIIVLINQLYIRNSTFIFICVSINMLFLMHYLRTNLDNQRAKLAGEIKQILDDK